MSKLGSNNETDSLEEFFSGKLKNESMVPSDKVWQQIEGSLSQDKKRRRRFIWLFFSSLFFIATGIATYVVMGNHAAISLSKINNVKNKTAATTVDIKTPAETAVTENNISTKTNITSPEKENIAAENAGREEKVSTVKIQLGAFKKQIDKSMFDKTGLDIKQETNENGITRYYAEVPENQKQEALQKAQHAGFADAFVREDMLLAVKNSEAKNIIPAKPVTQPAAALLATKNTEAKNKTKNITLANVPVVAPTKNSKPVVNDTKNTNNELPVASNNHTAKNDVAKTENVKADETKQTANTKIASTNTNSVAETNKPPEEIIPGAAIVKQDDVAKTDSV
ncbi:MAG TPA: hypothetical protein VKG26_03320, partial [Bacteroidia bacterium]|nr:hypothetical protein [Bacteroidia bacterium]